MQIDSLAVSVSVAIVGVVTAAAEIQCHIGQRGNIRRKKIEFHFQQKKNLLKIGVHASTTRGGEAEQYSFSTINRVFDCLTILITIN